MLRKKKWVLILIVFMFYTVGIVFASGVPTSIIINDKYIKSDISGILIDGYVYIPVRGISELFNSNVEWIEETKEIIVSNEDDNIIMKLNSNKIIINNLEQEIDQKIFSIDGLSYAPLRFLSENLGLSVEWDGEIYDVKLFKNNFEVSKELIDENHYLATDFELLAKIIEIESNGKSLELNMAVGNVVLNRVKSDRFPDTIYDVLHQKGQFPPVYKESFKTKEASLQSRVAAKRVLEGENNIEECLFFNSKPFSSKKNDFYSKIDGEYFYK